ncbi:uncharacterized protein LOC142349311 isoform X2 [Convolutriloba macropyga]
MAGDFPDNSRMYYSTPSDANTLYTERNWQRTRTMPVGRTDEANLNSHVNQLIAKVCNLESKFGQSYQQRNHQILQILQEDQNIQTTTAFRGNELYCLREDLKDMFQKLKYLEIRLNKIEEVVKNVHRNQEEFKHESSSVGRGGVEYELVPRNSPIEPSCSKNATNNAFGRLEPSVYGDCDHYSIYYPTAYNEVGFGLTVKAGETTNLGLPHPSSDNHIKIKQDDSLKSLHIYVFQSVWSNCKPIESKLKKFSVRDNHLYLQAKWKWTPEESSGLMPVGIGWQKVPVDFAICNSALYFVICNRNALYSVEKWSKITDGIEMVMKVAEEVSLADANIDRQNTFSLESAGSCLLFLQRIDFVSSRLTVMENHIVRFSCILDVSVDRQPKFSVAGDYLVFPHKSSFHVVKWKQGSVVIKDASGRTTRSVEVEGSDWVIGSFSLGKGLTYLLELHNDQEKKSVLFAAEQLKPITLDQLVIERLQLPILGLFGCSIDGVMLYYDGQSLGILHLTETRNEYLPSTGFH